jgi:hypothetical protein
MLHYYPMVMWFGEKFRKPTKYPFRIFGKFKPFSKNCTCTVNITVPLLLLLLLSFCNYLIICHKNALLYFSFGPGFLLLLIIVFFLHVQMLVFIQTPRLLSQHVNKKAYYYYYCYYYYYYYYRHHRYRISRFSASAGKHSLILGYVT